MNSNNKYGLSSTEKGKKKVEYDGVSMATGPKRPPPLFIKDVVDGRSIMKQYSPEIKKTEKALKRCLKNCTCC